MTELGRILQKARESKQLTLDDIQERTNIRKRYLQAIEEGDLSVIPGLVYARGFIKLYAEQLGLDGQALLEEYGLLNQPNPVQPAKADTSVPSRRERSTKQNPPAAPAVEPGNRLFPQVLMGILVIGLLGVGYWFLTQKETASEPPQPQVQEPVAPPLQQPANPPVPPVAEPKPTGPIKADVKERGRSVYKVEGDRIKLDIQVANGDCWMEIVADGEIKYSKTATSGTVLPVEASKEIKIVAGFSPALSIKANGVPVELEQVKGGYEYLFQKK
ncbi:helix-turn-helix domain-containing protein [Effusibacillus lacus]|uniref:Helix-turn-helix domain-containing protein n=1 Tax=Effusibacillus lacus TaxID=1348429 RepID=A0A292YL24_9BACL|nr:helix-turn-helix domain-containing protein [Effusibacillus lacus]